MSDAKTNLQQLKDQIRQFCADRDWGSFHGPKDLAIGAVTEASELLEIFRFQSDEASEQILKDEKTRQEVADELADVFFFVLRFAEKNNFDLSEAFTHKMNKNAQKYPIEKSKGSNKKYTHYV